MLDRFIHRLRHKGDPGAIAETPYGAPDDYRVLEIEAKRHDIYEFCKEFGEYIHREKPANLIFLDRSARAAWIGVHEYLKTRYPDDSFPGISFVNPDGFGMDIPKSREVSFAAHRPVYALHKKKGYTSEHDVFKKAAKDFSKAFPHLLKDKDKPLVIFDTCSHTGASITAVLNALEEAGFSDVRTVTANSPDFLSPIKSDARLDKRTVFRGCYPFAQSFATKKSKVGVVSKRDPETNQKWINQTRKQIRQIIREEGKN